MKKFTKENLSKNEIESIRAWTDDSSDIKAYMWGLVDDEVAQKHSENLFGLFDKYSSNLKKGTKLYRGMSFTKDDFYFYGYDDIDKNEIHIPDTKAIVSFSADKRKAFEYANYSNSKNYKIIYILEGETQALDISKISAKNEDKESIMTKNREYLVVNTKTFKRGDALWKAIKLKKEK